MKHILMLFFSYFGLNYCVVFAQGDTLNVMVIGAHPDDCEGHYQLASDS